jgi:DNA polymerase III delta prime subunit
MMIGMKTMLETSQNEFLWVEKYRPKKIQDCILPEDIKNTFQEFVNLKNIPNLLLCGTAGVGKTTVAKAMLDELGADYIMINGSLNGNIDTLRTTIMGFASTVSMWGGRKYVILDEADYLTHATQPALRNFIEQFSHNCGFILTCNYKNKIIEPLHSRCSVIEFKIGKKDMPAMAAQFFSRVREILASENVTYDKKVIAEVINKHVPDWRRVLNELQRYSSKGEIDSGLLGCVADLDIKDLVKYLRDKDFTSMRRWVGVNSTVDQHTIYRQLYDSAYDFMKPTSIPNLVLILADYQYKAAFAVVPEINLSACLTQIMMDCEWK